MTTTQINLIVKILLNEEENLSDGYQFYCEDKTIKLEKIAKIILSNLKQEEEDRMMEFQKKQDEINARLNFSDRCDNKN